MKGSEILAFAAPAVAILCLSLADGGYGLEARCIAGIGAWLLVILLIASGVGSKLVLGRLVYFSVGVILALAALSFASSLWSGSVERSFFEAERVLVYLGMFIAVLLIAQTAQLRQRFAEGLTFAVGVVAVLALISRLAPDILTASNPDPIGARLHFPLGYWNADGTLFGIGLVLLAWMSRNGSTAFFRWISMATAPAALLALYFTYSRGGLLAAILGGGLLIAFSHHRLWHLFVIAISALATVPAIILIQDRRELADGVLGQAAKDQGATVGIALIVGIVLSLVAFGLLNRVRDRNSPLGKRAVGFSRDLRTLRVIGGALAVIAIGLLLAVGGRTWDSFASPDLAFPDRPEEHFSQLSGAGRNDFWRVAIDSFEDKPILGSGAGTYEFDWELRRSIDVPVQDAHSLYLEMFAELGIVGGLLILALVGGLIWIGISAWRGASGRERELCSALLAAMITFAVGAAFDWFWEIPALGAVFFLCAGVLVSVRSAQLAAVDFGVERPDRGSSYGIALAGLALGWISIAAMVGPLLMQRELTMSQEAAASGDIQTAFNRAQTARSIQPWAATPYVQLGGLAELRGGYTIAEKFYEQATAREGDNWQLWYLRSRAAYSAGDAGASALMFERARQLNPRAPELQQSSPAVETTP